MNPDEMKAREAAVQALWREVGEFDEVTPKEVYLANAAIDAYLAALSPLPDEQLDEERFSEEKLDAYHETAASAPEAPGPRWNLHYAADVSDLLGELERSYRIIDALRALSAHPDEEH